DLFAAGIVDNGIGPLVCIGEATGGGGANVWDSSDLRAAMRAAGIRLPRLAPGVSFTLSLRRAVRTGTADGQLVEDAGIPGQSHDLTYRDIFEKNVDVIEHCAGLLAAQPVTDLEVTRARGRLAVTTTALDRLDIFCDGHPLEAGLRLRGDGTRQIGL